MTARELRIGLAPVLALRVTYVGELGYELHLPTEYAAHVYELLWAAGRDLGLADAGYRAIDSLRLEKRYLYWGSDITPDYTPYEAGLGFAVLAQEEVRLHRPRRAGKGQGGRPEAPADHPAGRRRRAALWRRGDPPQRQGFGRHLDAPAGAIRSARRSRLGYVPADEAGHDDYEVEAFTRRHAARRIAGAAVDPGRKKILA